MAFCQWLKEEWKPLTLVTSIAIVSGLVAGYVGAWLPTNWFFHGVCG